MSINPYNSPASETRRISWVRRGRHDDIIRQLLNLIPPLVALCCFAIYVAVLLAESAYRAGGIGFNELLTVERMMDALSVTPWTDVFERELYPADWVSLAGMLAFLTLTWDKIRSIPMMPIVVYFAVLFFVGGGIGFLALLFLPVMLDPLDGEFLADGVARWVAIGVWMSVVLAVLGFRLYASRKDAKAAAVVSSHQ